jgi:hypothetical protein
LATASLHGDTVVNRLAWTADGALMVAGRREGADEGGVLHRVQWGGGSGVITHSAAAHVGSVRGLATAGMAVATGGADGLVCLWSAGAEAGLVSTGTYDRPELAVAALAFSGDGAYLAVAAREAPVEVVRVADGSRVLGVAGTDAAGAVAWTTTTAGKLPVLAVAAERTADRGVETGNVELLVPRTEEKEKEKERERDGAGARAPAGAGAPRGGGRG